MPPSVPCCANVVLSPAPLPTPAPVSVPVSSPVPPPTSGGASSCDDLGWTNAAKYGSTSVCGESDLGLGGCSGYLSWSDAEAFCGGAGARLCTAAELQADEAAGSGCGLDRNLVWSGDPCSGGYMAALGYSRYTYAPSCEAANAANIAVRCCANVHVPVPAPTESPVSAPIPAPTMAPIIPVPVFAPSKSPTGVVVSVSTCDELGWRVVSMEDGTYVCGESNDGLGGCSGTVSQSEAAAFCEAAGARLCTASEFQADVAMGTGCGLDRKMVWSCDECTGGYYVAPGSSRLAVGPNCKTASSFDTYDARCCADNPAQIADPTRSPLRNPTPGPVAPVPTPTENPFPAPVQAPTRSPLLESETCSFPCNCGKGCSVCYTIC